MSLPTAVSVPLIAILVGGLSIVGCSQKTRGQEDPARVQNSGGGQERNGRGQYVVVDGERVFVPAFYLDPNSPLRAPEKVAREILRGRKIIRAGKATSTFTPSQKGTELAVSMIHFEPGEPQTLPEQIAYVQERVTVFNQMLRESELPAYDTVSGAATGLLIAFKILGKKDALAEARRRQQTFREQIFLDESYQGRTDPEKQSTYDWLAFFAIEALNESKKAKRSRSDAEREAAEKKSRYYAELIDNFVSSGQLDPAP